MKAYKHKRNITPLILYLDTRYRQIINSRPQLLYPLEGTLVPIKQKVQWMFRSENVLPLSRLKPQIVQPTA